MNSITIAGNATKDATIRDVGSDKVASFSIADNGYEKGEKTTIYYDVSVWGKRAEAAAQYIKKGAQLTVVGRMSPPYEKDGKFYLKVTATDFTLPARGGDDAPAQRTTAPPSRPAAPAPTYDDSEIPF